MKIQNIFLSVIIGLLQIVQLSTPAFSQTEDLDSLISVLDELPEDTSRVRHLNGLAKTVLYNDPTESYGYVSEALTLSEKLNDYPGMADAYKTLGNLSYMWGNYTDALNNYVSSLDISRENNDLLNIANLYNNIGNLYEEQNNPNEARSYYQNALAIYRDINDFDGQATIFHNIGVMYADSYPDSAIVYIGKALQINIELQDERLDALAYGNLGYSYLNKGEYDTARLYFENSLGSFTKLKDNEGISNQYLNLGELSQAEGKYKESVQYLNKSEKIATEHRLNSLLVDDFNFMSKAYQETGDFEKALSYHEKYKNLSDSIFTIEKDQALFQLQAKNEHEKTLEILNNENELQAERLRAAKLQNYLLIVMTGFALIVMLIASYYFMHRNRTNQQLKEQNKEILEQKQEIENQRKKVSDANEILKDKNLKLNKLNKEKNYLMHVVAHDLKSPLNQMAGLVKVIMLEDEILTDTQKSCLEKIETVSSRLSHMVDKILDIEAIEKKSYNMKFEELDLRDILGETINEFKPIAQNKDIQISSNMNGKISLVKLDRQHTVQIFSNLISNAIKFSPPHKEININIKSKNGEIITEIIDQGPGLTDKDKESVFQKFKKLSAQPTGDEESSGLGLSIVKNYVEAMNGKVWVESTFGKGANFKVSFQKA